MGDKSKFELGQLVANRYELIKQVNENEDYTNYICNYDGWNFFVKIYFSGIKVDEELFEKMKSLGSANICRVIDSGIFKNHFCIIRPYYNNGNIMQIAPVHHEYLIKEFIPVVSNALNEIHKAGIMHGKITPGNIFYSDFGNDIVLGEFGISLCRKCDEEGDFYSESQYIEFLPPEAINGIVSKEADFYALGITIYCLAVGVKPYQNMEEKEILKAVFTEALPIPEKVNPTIAKFIRGLTIKSKDKRWGYDEVVRALNGEDVEIVDDFDYDISFFDDEMSEDFNDDLSLDGSGLTSEGNTDFKENADADKSEIEENIDNSLSSDDIEALGLTYLQHETDKNDDFSSEKQAALQDNNSRNSAENTVSANEHIDEAAKYAVKGILSGLSDNEEKEEDVPLDEEKLSYLEGHNGENPQISPEYKGDGLTEPEADINWETEENTAVQANISDMENTEDIKSIDIEDTVEYNQDDKDEEAVETFDNTESLEAVKASDSTESIEAIGAVNSENTESIEEKKFTEPFEEPEVSENYRACEKEQPEVPSHSEYETEQISEDKTDSIFEADVPSLNPFRSASPAKKENDLYFSGTLDNTKNSTIESIKSNIFEDNEFALNDTDNNITDNTDNADINLNFSSSDNKTSEGSYSAAEDKGITFLSQVCYTPKELAKAFLNNWDAACELLYGTEVYDYFKTKAPDTARLAKACTELDNKNQGLFRFIYETSPELTLCYKGVTFYDLCDTTDGILLSAHTELYEEMLKDGILSFYLIKNNNAEKAAKIIYLEDMARNKEKNIDLIICILMYTLSDNPTFLFDERSFKTVDDFVDYLDENPSEVDSICARLTGDVAFYGWIEFLGYGKTLNKLIEQN